MLKFTFIVGNYEVDVSGSIVGLLALLTSSFVISANTAQAQSTRCAGSSFYLLEQRARQGDEEAAYYLARKYMTEDCDTVRSDKGVQMLQRLTHQGFAPAMFDVGKMLVGSSQTPEEEAEGMLLIRKSAEHGHAEAEAFYGLMLMADASDDAERDVALYWLGSAADKGQSGAAMTASILYKEGLHGIHKDPCLASLWEEAAFLIADPYAQGSHDDGTCR